MGKEKMDMKIFMLFIGLLSFVNAFWNLDLKKAEETLKEIEKEEQIILEQKEKEQGELIEEPHGQNEMKYIKKKLDFNQKRCACDCTGENDQYFQFDFKNENETISNDN